MAIANGTATPRIPSEKSTRLCAATAAVPARSPTSPSERSRRRAAAIQIQAKVPTSRSPPGMPRSRSACSHSFSTWVKTYVADSSW